MRKFILFMTICGLYTVVVLSINSINAQAPNSQRALKENILLRTYNSETFDVYNGTRLKRVYSKKKFYSDNRQSKQIDLSVITEKKDDYTHAVKAGPYTYRFNSSNTGKGHRFTKGDYYVTYIPAGNWKGKKSTITPTVYGIKEEILFHSISDSTVSWNVLTNANVELKNNELIFSDNEGISLFKIPQATAFDADGVPVPVTISFSGGTLSYCIIPESETIWPVKLDPSTEIGDDDDKTGRVQHYGEGSYTYYRNAAEGNFIQYFSLYVGLKKYISTFYIFRGFLVFDTSSLPEDAIIDSAKVVVVVSVDESDNDFDMKLVATDISGSMSTEWFNDFDGWLSSGVYNVTGLSDTLGTAGISVGDTLKFTLNSVGIDSIHVDSETKFALLSLEDINESEPSGFEYIVFEDDSPYIEIWYSYPPNPKNFIMTALDTCSMACAWDDMSDNEDFFEIISLPDSAVVDSLAADAVSDTVNGLSENTKYIWKVAADTSGVKFYSNPDTAYTFLAPPEYSEITIVPISSDTLRISVAEPPNAFSDSTGMEVLAVSGSGATGSGKQTGIYSYCDGGLNPDSIYVYKVRYFNGDGDSTSWSPEITYSMNGLDTLKVYLGGDGHDDYNVDYGGGQVDSTVVRVGASDSGEQYDGFLSFGIPWYVHKGGVDSLFLSMTRAEEESSRIPQIRLYGIPVKNIDPAEQINVGAQDSTDAVINWTVLDGTGQKASPNLRDIFREWQELAPYRDYTYGLGFRLDDNSQADSVRAVFLDYSHQSYANGTLLTIYYTPGDADTLDASPDNFNITVEGPDSLTASWTDNSAFELGFVLLNVSDSTQVAGTDTLAENTTSFGVGNLTPNTVYNWFVRGFSAVDDSSSSGASARTLARTPGITAVSAVSHTSLKFILDPLDNPDYTVFAVQDSATGLYVDGSADPDTLRAGPPGEWGWKTYSQWGAALGDTISGLSPDSLYVIRAKAQSGE